MSRNRIAYEKQVIVKMIRLYCRYKEGNKTLCPSCLALQEYALARLDRCPFGDNKGRVVTVAFIAINQKCKSGYDKSCVMLDLA